MIDVPQQINASQRRVGGRALEAAGRRTVSITRTYDAPIEDVWDTCTNPERIPRWFLPITGELRPGGHYQLEGNAGGTIERCDPPHGFTATWEYAGSTGRIELSLSTQEGGGTLFELEHIAPDDEAKWAEFGPGAVGVGWDLGLRALTTHLISGESADPQAAARWGTSPEGREFITLSNQAWCDAWLASGVDPANARGAAERTLAFYTSIGAHTPDAS
jgi:uncharacterized protein YndB with AHSA1/START domain